MTETRPLPPNWLPDGFDLARYHWLDSGVVCPSCDLPSAICNLVYDAAQFVHSNDRLALGALQQKMRDEYLEWEHAR